MTDAITTKTVMDEVAENIGERLVKEDITTLLQLNTALVTGMERTASAGVAPVRKAVRFYLTKYANEGLPRNEAVTAATRT